MFDEVDGYVRAYAKDRSLAIIPVSMAADLFGITNPAIVARAKKGLLKEINVAGVRYIQLQSVLDVLADQDGDVQVVKAFLEQQVRNGVASVEYAPVMDLLGLTTERSADRNRIGQILGLVSRKSYAEKGVLLSVIVHKKGTRMPSEKGFFGLVENICEDWGEKDITKEKFVAKETRRVLKAYKK